MTYKPQFLKGTRNATKRRGDRIHVIDTEVREFDEALDIIAAHQGRLKGAKTFKDRQPSLRSQLATAKARASLLKRHGKISLALGHHSTKTIHPPNRSKPVDPFKSLSLEEKHKKIREWYAAGYFKPGELAARFGVTAREVKTLIWGKPRYGDQWS